MELPLQRFRKLQRIYADKRRWMRIVKMKNPVTKSLTMLVILSKLKILFFWAMNARLAPIHFATQDHPQVLNPPNMETIPGKRLARDVQSEAWQRVAEELKGQLHASVLEQ